MRVTASKKTIAVTIRIVERIEIDAREASFLREMAQFCVSKNMAGCHAARLLDDALAAAGVPDRDSGPVYGLFEEVP